MSAAVETYRDDLEATYAVDFSRDGEPTKARPRFPEYRRKGSAPTRVNGIHCRRQKRWTWGRGRGARMLSLQAFASAVLLSVLALGSSSVAHGADLNLHGIGFNMVSGAAATPAGNGYGVVTNDFYMGEMEVTVSQYAAFLTATGAPNGTFKVGQPITASGGVYTANAGFENRPITFVSWFDGARFANWLQNGATSGSSTETGAYTLTGATSAVPRNAGATVFLPSANEWTKAAYYLPTGSAWNLYATNSNTPPTASAPNSSNDNSANFNQAVGSTSPVGAYSIATSAYRLYDMVGNVAETTDTLNQSGNVIRLGGNWSQAGIQTSSTTLTFSAAGSNNGNLGFRVAAVPEPSTYALIVAGVASAGGFRLAKRRRRPA